MHLHKLIYKFQEDIENLVHDVKQREQLAKGKGSNLEIKGEAHVLQIFNVTEPGLKKGSPKRVIQVAGSRVHDGEMDNSLKYRIIRNDECLVEDLKVHSLKKFKKDVTKVEKGMECGIAFEDIKVTLEEGDVLECYVEKPAEPPKFNMKPGMRTTY